MVHYLLLHNSRLVKMIQDLILKGHLFFLNIAGYIISLIFNTIAIFNSVVRILSYIGIGYRWIIATLRLFLFAMVLLPAWWTPLFPYIFSRNILRGVRYGSNTRNELDIYFPSQSSPAGGHPVAVLVWGGAWTIGYKVWPFILAQNLAARGTLCFVIDYRNFPQGNIYNMVEDITNAMIWSYDNVAKYGGNPDEITLIGQSAGAHLTVLSLLQQVLGDHDHFWDVSKLRHYVGISGAYDLVSLKPILDKHGLDEELFRAIMDQDLISNSPVFYLKSKFSSDKVDEVRQKLPPITLVHGTKDKTISAEFTMVFADELSKFGINVNTKLFPGKSHTDFFLEDIIEGKGEPFVNYLHAIIHKKDQPPIKRLKHKAFTHPILVNMARHVNPF